MRRTAAPPIVLGIAIAMGGCSTLHMEVELEKTRYALHQANAEIERLKVQAERATQAATEYADTALRCEANQGYPPPGEAVTAVLRGNFKFDGQPAVVTLHIVGNGVDESFRSDALGRVAVLLPVGTYEAQLSAAGYAEQRIRFDVRPEIGSALETELSAVPPVPASDASTKSKKTKG